MPAIRITYAADVELSQEEAVEAQVVLEDAGEETSLEAQLRLHDSTLDVVETALPQKSLRVDGGEIRFILYNDGNDAIYTKIISAMCGNLIAQGPVAVPVRAQEPVEVYLNGEYWGLYTGARSSKTLLPVLRAWRIPLGSRWPTPTERRFAAM